APSPRGGRVARVHRGHAYSPGARRGGREGQLGNPGGGRTRARGRGEAWPASRRRPCRRDRTPGITPRRPDPCDHPTARHQCRYGARSAAASPGVPRPDRVKINRLPLPTARRYRFSIDMLNNPLVVAAVVVVAGGYVIVRRSVGEPVNVRDLAV